MLAHQTPNPFNPIPKSVDSAPRVKEAELRDLLAGFAVDDLVLVRKEYVDDDGTPRSRAHYHVKGYRL